MRTKLENISIQNFKGINDQKPVIIDFNTIDNNIVYLQGDQGEGKTSTLEGIMLLMGAAFEIKLSELFNKDNKSINESMKFIHDEVEYQVIATDDRLVLKSLREGDGSTKDKWATVSGPKDYLNRIFKKCIINQELKFNAPEKQVEWAINLFPIPSDARKIILDAQKEIKNLVDVVRPGLSRNYKLQESILTQNGLYERYKESPDTLKKEIDLLLKNQKKSESFKETIDSYNKYQDSVKGLETLKEEKKTKDQEIEEIKLAIEELNKKLEIKNIESSDLQERIVNGEKHIDKNKNIIKKYDDVMELQKSAIEDSKKINDYKLLVEALDKYNQFSSSYQDCDSNIRSSIEQIKSIRADYIPEMQDVEIITENEYKEGEIVKPIGIYRNGVSLRTLSGSEYVTTLITIIKASGSRYIFIDDLATFGTDTIDYLNKLAEEIADDGGIIFASEMERGSELIITLEKEIK